MQFVYRAPLFHFDHEDPEVLEKNRDQIIAAISLSSKDFARELEKRSFNDLDQKIRIKLRKYLLRGRFRPTPFGLFAGVGTGKWGTKMNMDLPLQSKQLSQHRSTGAIGSYDLLTSEYLLTPGLRSKYGYYHAMVYDGTAQHWKECKVPENRLFESLFASACDKPIKFTDFLRLIKPAGFTLGNEKAKDLWSKIVATGFLVPDKPTKKTGENGTDIILTNPVEVPEKIRRTLKQFIDSAGNLFAKEDSPYLSNFKKWFTNRFDDRFVSLSHLLGEGEFVSGEFQYPGLKEATKDIAASLTAYESKEIDLRNTVTHRKLDNGIYDLQILYRIDQDGHPVIENMVCNRPFVYTGRFNRDSRIKSYSEKTRDLVFDDPDVIYANLMISETASINHICAAENIFKHEISPFPTPSAEQLSFSDLYIGISDNRIHLFHKNNGKQVVPVVLHPLNGSHISHPAMRLLWETGHQDRYRFLPYQSSFLGHLSCTPRLNWGELCLQPRRWKLAKENLSDAETLSRKLASMDLPETVLAGNMDRELLVKPSNPDDLQIVWQELKRNGSLNLAEALWYPSETALQKNGEAVYPQFVYQHSSSQHVPKLRGAFNPITESQTNCLCFTITVSSSEVPEVLEQLFQYLGQKVKQSKLPTWFFLIYGKNSTTEIRLRLLDLDTNQKESLFSWFGGIFSEEGWNWKTADYFPENSKYGTMGLKDSHLLFHLESGFLARTAIHNTGLYHSADWKENLVIGLWLKIIGRSPSKELIFAELQQQVKAMQSALVITYKKDFSFLEKDENGQFDTETYVKTICGHECFNLEKEAHLRLIFNHLHMMVNRFFPEDTSDFERRIRYRLYRETGKNIYNKNKETPADKNTKSIDHFIVK